MSELDVNTPASVILKKIQRIQGKYKSTKISMLKDNNKKIFESQEIADKLAQTFAENSSNENYDQDFLQYKNSYSTKYNQQQVEDLDNSVFNKKIEIVEISETLLTCKNSSPGPYQIPNIMLKNLPQSALELIHKIFNKIWSDRVFPDQ